VIYSLNERRCPLSGAKKQSANQQISKYMRYETTESWTNAQARKVARWDREQAAHDAMGTNNREFPIEQMKASPRLPGEDLIAYGSRLKGGAK